MDFNKIIEEIKLLNQFNLNSKLYGIKIHQSNASPETVNAATRRSSNATSRTFRNLFLPRRCTVIDLAHNDSVIQGIESNLSGWFGSVQPPSV